MAFKVPASKAKDERFEFELEGKTYSLPNMNFIPVETGLLFQEEKPLPAVLAACGDDEEARAAIRKLSMDQLTALVEAWGEESGAAAGE